MKLSEVRVGESCIVKSVREHGAFCRRLCDLGFVEGTRITVLAVAPLGDTIEVYLRGYRITLRKNDASLVEVTPAERKSIWKRR